MFSVSGGDDTRGKAVFIVTIVTLVATTVFVGARLVSRFGVLQHGSADDWSIIFAWLIAFGLSFSIIYGTVNGLGRHDADIPDLWRERLQQVEYAFTVLYNPALMVTKTSILIFYLRVAKTTEKLLKVASYITLVIANTAGIAFTLLFAFRCHPVSAAYSPLRSGKCISIVTLFLCSAPINIITDVAILVLPIPVLTRLRLPQRQKTILVFTFALGIFVTIVDVVRIYYLQQAAQIQDQARVGSGDDFSYNASLALMWSAVEVNVGIICACIPTLKPLIDRILPFFTAASHDSQLLLSAHSALPTRLSSIAYTADRMQSLVEHEMSMMAPPASLNVAHSRTMSSHVTDTSIYFGFVRMKRPNSMLKTKGKESFKYCTMVTILFFLKGFSYTIINAAIPAVAHQSTSQIRGLAAAYWGAYFFGPLTVGQWVLRNSGFKVTFVCGLCIYGTGALMFWPSAVLTSFPGFVISNFVVGFGLAVLETAGNTFLALCGPPRHAEYRLLLAQGVNSVGLFLSRLLSQKALFASVLDRPSLINVQWAYLTIALFTVILALFFYYMPLPEAGDTDLQLQSDDIGVYPDTPSIFTPRIPLIYLTLALAVFAQFSYTAAQECLSAGFDSLLTVLSIPNTSTPLTLSSENYGLVRHTTFALGRFIFAPLCLIFPPRTLLFLSFGGCIIFSALTTTLHMNINGLAGLIIVTFFLEGPIWPIIFAISLRGMGKRTKLAGALITAAASGAAPFPFVMWGIQQVPRKTVQYSFSVIVALFAFGTIYPIYLNLVPMARKQVDPVTLSSTEDRPFVHGFRPTDRRPDPGIRRLSKHLNGVIV
ncbi:hypothetical protein ACLOAV_008285 [Pseudogymnoascus australis]